MFEAQKEEGIYAIADIFAATYIREADLNIKPPKHLIQVSFFYDADNSHNTNSLTFNHVFSFRL